MFIIDDGSQLLALIITWSFLFSFSFRDTDDVRNSSKKKSRIVGDYNSSPERHEKSRNEKSREKSSRDEKSRDEKSRDEKSRNETSHDKSPKRRHRSDEKEPGE